MMFAIFRRSSRSVAANTVTLNVEGKVPKTACDAVISKDRKPSNLVPVKKLTLLERARPR